MHWITLSLLAPAIYACNSFIDKYVLARKINDSRCLPIYSAVAAGILGTAGWAAAGWPTLGQKNDLILLLSGAATLYALALYFYALRKNHTSYIIALLETAPIFTLLLSIIFFGDTLSLWQLVGFFLTLCAVIGLSADKIKGRLRFDHAFFAICAANVLFAFAVVVIKFASGLHGFMPILVYQSWGLAVGGATLFFAFRPVRQAFFKSFRAAGTATLGIMFLNEILFNVANSVTYLAVSFGPVALVSVLGGTQVLYGVFFGVFLSVLFPHVYSEDATTLGVLKKVTFSALLFAGVGLIGASST